MFRAAVCLLLLVLLCNSVTWSQTPPNVSLPQCDVITRLPTPYSLFFMNGKALRPKTIVLSVNDTNAEGCIFNMSVVKTSLNVTETEQMFISIVINCLNNNTVNVVNNEPRNDNIIGAVQISGCTINAKDLIELGNLFDTRVINNVKNKRKALDKAHFTDNHCDRLKVIGTYWYETIDVDKFTFDDVFWCSDEYPLMAEVIFANVSWESLPNQFVQKFPYLQGLEIHHNRLRLPPTEFPWHNDTMALPKSLSRTPIMEDHYSKSLGLSIPSNIYRRVYNLNFNMIEDLSNFSFHGFLHQILLKGNNLTVIGNDTFNKVLGLQAIDLSLNNLTHLPNGVFLGLTEVRLLDLSRNQIRSIESEIFNDLVSVKVLYLSHNNISSIGSEAFGNLMNLVEIHLEHNNLMFLKPDSFPLQSLALKKLILHHNPLYSVPEFVFWFRKLELVDLSSSGITLNNLTSLIENMDTNRVLSSIVDSASSSDMNDLMTRAETLRRVDLRNNNIESLQLDENVTVHVNKLLSILLLHYEFDLSGNPLKCDCTILPISKIINNLLLKTKITEDEYFFKKWKCVYPQELHDAVMLKVKPDETYCAVHLESCPSQCSCYKRTGVDNIIVDCRSLSLQGIHNIFPDSPKLELWYSQNNITSLPQLPVLENVVSLDLSHNRIQELSASSISMMRSMQYLYLHDNLLAYLPSEIVKLDLKNVTLYPNPLHCDCYSIWLKRWLLTKRVTSYDQVTCNSKDNEDGNVFIEVPDYSFTCPEVSTANVVVPSVVCSLLLLFLVIVVLVLYAYRLEIKVLLFVYFGIHPFDKDNARGSENIDCVVVHSGASTDWVMQSIVDILESENYRYIVCGMARDFIVGFSFQENIAKIIRRSKRIIFCLSKDWTVSNESFNIAWNIAQDKIKESKSHFAIVVTHGVSRKDITDEDLIMFIKHGRYIDSQDKLFSNKVLYYMPRCKLTDVERLCYIEKGRKSTEISKCFVNRYVEEDAARPDETIKRTDRSLVQKALYNPSHAFLSFADEDEDYVYQVIQPCLESKGFSLIIPERDFVPGASKEENILHAIDSSQRTLFILSEKHCRDEWSLFTFRTAFEKTLREQINHLLVIVLEDVARQTLDSEMDNYLNNYICLHKSDRWFEKKLLNGMPYLKDVEGVHTSPMFVSEVQYMNSVAHVEEVTINTDVSGRNSHRNETNAENQGKVMEEGPLCEQETLTTAL